MVRDFIDKTTEMTSAAAHESYDTAEILDYLDTHLHKDARFKSTMTYKIPGHDAQKNTISMSKQEYIDTILQAPKAVGDYDNTIDVTSIKIAKDGGNATVKTKSREEGEMKLPTGESIPMVGVSNCNQILVIGRNDQVQMYSAQCATEIEFSEMDMGMGF